MTGRCVRRRSWLRQGSRNRRLVVIGWPGQSLVYGRCAPLTREDCRWPGALGGLSQEVWRASSGQWCNRSRFCQRSPPAGAGVNADSLPCRFICCQLRWPTPLFALVYQTDRDWRCLQYCQPRLEGFESVTRAIWLGIPVALRCICSLTLVIELEGTIIPSYHIILLQRKSHTTKLCLWMVEGMLKLSNTFLHAASGQTAWRVLRSVVVYVGSTRINAYPEFNPNSRMV